MQWLELELRVGACDPSTFYFWSGFGVCELALQWLELRRGVCDPSTLFWNGFVNCEFALQWMELRVELCAFRWA